MRSTHGDWQMRCEVLPPGAKAEQCALVQNVAAEDRPNLTLLVIVLKTADQVEEPAPARRRPAGVLLPSGLGLKIDDKDIGRAGFVRCLTTGCVAEVVMDDALLGQLKGGKSATFIVFQTPEEGVGVPVSLNGFGPGVRRCRDRSNSSSGPSARFAAVVPWPCRLRIGLVLVRGEHCAQRLHVPVHDASAGGSAAEGQRGGSSDLP